MCLKQCWFVHENFNPVWNLMSHWPLSEYESQVKQQCWFRKRHFEETFKRDISFWKKLSFNKKQIAKNVIRKVQILRLCIIWFHIENPQKKTYFTSSKEEVIQQLNAKKFKLQDNVDGRSEYWRTYQLIVNEKGTPANQARCRICGRVDEYDTKKGTKHLGSHYKSCNALTTPPPINKSFPKKEICITRDEKSMLATTALEMCYKDIRPFSAIEGEGLISLLLAISKLTTKYGLLSEETLRKMLPCDRTVSIISVNSSLNILVHISCSIFVVKRFYLKPIFK